MTLTELCAAFLARFCSPRIKDLARYRMRMGCNLRRIDKLAAQVARIRAVELRTRTSHRSAICSAAVIPAAACATTSPASAPSFRGPCAGLLERNPAHGVEQPPPPPPERRDNWMPRDPPLAGRGRPNSEAAPA